MTGLLKHLFDDIDGTLRGEVAIRGGLKRKTEEGAKVQRYVLRHYDLRVAHMLKLADETLLAKVPDGLLSLLRANGRTRGDLNLHDSVVASVDVELSLQTLDELVLVEADLVLPSHL